MPTFYIIDAKSLYSLTSEDGEKMRDHYLRFLRDNVEVEEKTCHVLVDESEDECFENERKALEATFDLKIKMMTLEMYALLGANKVVVLSAEKKRKVLAMPNTPSYTLILDDFDQTNFISMQKAVLNFAFIQYSLMHHKDSMPKISGGCLSPKQVSEYLRAQVNAYEKLINEEKSLDAADAFSPVGHADYDAIQYLNLVQNELTGNAHLSSTAEALKQAKDSDHLDAKLYFDLWEIAEKLKRPSKVYYFGLFQYECLFFKGLLQALERYADVSTLQNFSGTMEEDFEEIVSVLPTMTSRDDGIYAHANVMLKYEEARGNLQTLIVRLFAYMQGEELLYDVDDAPTASDLMYDYNPIIDKLLAFEAYYPKYAEALEFPSTQSLIAEMQADIDVLKVTGDVHSSVIQNRIGNISMSLHRAVRPDTLKAALAAYQHYLSNMLKMIESYLRWEGEYYDAEVEVLSVAATKDIRMLASSTKLSHRQALDPTRTLEVIPEDKIAEIDTGLHKDQVYIDHILVAGLSIFNIKNATKKYRSFGSLEQPNQRRVIQIVPECIPDLKALHAVLREVGGYKNRYNTNMLRLIQQDNQLRVEMEKQADVAVTTDRYFEIIQQKIDCRRLYTEAKEKLLLADQEAGKCMQRLLKLSAFDPQAITSFDLDQLGYNVFDKVTLLDNIADGIAGIAAAVGSEKSHFFDARRRLEQRWSESRAIRVSADDLPIVAEIHQKLRDLVEDAAEYEARTAALAELGKWTATRTVITEGQTKDTVQAIDALRAPPDIADRRAEKSNLETGYSDMKAIVRKLATDCDAELAACLSRLSPGCDPDALLRFDATQFPGSDVSVLNHGIDLLWRFLGHDTLENRGSQFLVTRHKLKQQWDRCSTGEGEDGEEVHNYRRVAFV